MSNIDTAEIVICTLDKYQALMERAAQLERDVMTLQHKMEIEKLEAEKANLKEENSSLWLRVYKLEQEAKERGVSRDT